MKSNLLCLALLSTSLFFNACGDDKKDKKADAPITVKAPGDVGNKPAPVNPVKPVLPPTEKDATGDVALVCESTSVLSLDGKSCLEASEETCADAGLVFDSSSAECVTKQDQTPDECQTPAENSQNGQNEQSAQNSQTGKSTAVDACDSEEPSRQNDQSSQRS